MVLGQLALSNLSHQLILLILLILLSLSHQYFPLGQLLLSPRL
jgi:hypothetical protein